MAQITITIPDQYIDRILDAFDGAYLGREETTKSQWAKQHLALYVKDVVRSWEANQAADQARQDSLDATEEIEIT